MHTKTILVVEDNPQTLEVIQSTFIDADVTYAICSTTTEGWNLVSTRPEITHILIRMHATNIDGCELCRRIREVKSAEVLPILMIVSEDQLEQGAMALESGATDVLIDPFESRELRMRTNIVCCARQRRVDVAHPAGVPESLESPAAKVTFEVLFEELQPRSNFVAPKFDPKTMRFAYGVSEDQIAAWKNDETVEKVALDEVLVCPCCKGVPTFRQGCGSCGSAWTRPEILIHHYACAHIGPESEFRQGSNLVCPKCRQATLVAGSDFETVPGGQVCADCDAKTSQPELIGHCLNCQHRFPAHEAATLQLTGFYVHRVHEVVTNAGQVQHRQRRNRNSRSATGLSCSMASDSQDPPEWMKMLPES